VHNTFPLVSPSVYAACRDAGVPVVQTLHNYRWLCTAATFYRDDAVCELCGPTRIGAAIRHRCYRNSLVGSAAVALTQRRGWRQGTYARSIDACITLSRFAAARFIAAGLDAGRVHVKPNFVADAEPPGAGDGGYAVYAGRLSTEKGLATLLDAWRGLRDVPLRIVGDGPLLPELRARAEREQLPVQFLGLRPRDEVRGIIGGAALLVLPSQWFEGFPLVLVEAYARGTPVVAACIGSLAELVVPDETGLHFRPGDPAGLAAQVRALWADDARRLRLRHGARARYEAEYTAPRNLQLLLDIYAAAGAATR
jgi:glycosyltransferase involved in cell wall biosynthesis